MTSIQVCRTCLAQNTHMYIIANTPLQCFYERNTNLSLNTEDGRPSAVCYNCYDLLKKFHKFTDIAIKADEVLQKIYKSGTQITEQYISMIDKRLFKLHESPVSNDNLKSEESRNIAIVNMNTEKIEIKTEIEYETMAADTTDVSEEATTNYEIKIETELDIQSIKDKLLLEDRVQSQGFQHSPGFDENVPRDNLSVKKATGDIETKTIPKKRGQRNTGAPGRSSKKRKEDIKSSINDVKAKSKDSENDLTKKTGCEKEFECKYCDYKSTRKYDMTRHNRRIHVSEKPFACDYCYHRSSRKNDLIGHLRKHTGEKPFTCDYCEKKFPLKSDLSRHLRTHTDDSPFTCNYCGSTFTQKGNLSRHLSTHNGEKPFPCNYCGNKFTQKSNLLRHLRLHKGEKPFTCSHCDKKFPQKIHLTQHLMTHTGEKPFTCNYCDKKFSQRRVLTGHLMMHRGEKPFTCTYCGNKFTQKTYLTRHLRMHTNKEDVKY